MRTAEIEKITIKGFKSIKCLENFRPREINVFIGQNGAGKSNFIGFVKFLSNMLSGTGNLSGFTGLNGGASKFLFDGPEISPLLSGYINLKTTSGSNEYKFKLAHAAIDDFIYTEEQFRYTANQSEEDHEWHNLGAGHKESNLINGSSTGTTQEVIKKLLRQLIIYQFHNTTFNSPIRNIKPDLENNWFLEENGGNLAAVLFELKENQIEIYQKIIQIIQQILPFFDDFVLHDQYGKTYLRWREKNSNVTFVATQASDGMLRTMALTTLLCLPPKRLPAVMFLDEPELGLHPSAIKIICDLIKGVSEHCQVFMATQDADMLNEFHPDNVVVVTRNKRESDFHQLTEEELSEWVDDYSLAELWHQNIIGGKP